MDFSNENNNVSDVEVEFDENDQKIIQLYEVINELIDEQKARAQDLELLYAENDNLEILSLVEARNETVLKQVFEELALTEKHTDDEDSDDDSEDDEQDEGWEIYNSVVSNLNEYMQKVADFSAKLKAQQEVISHYEGPQEEDIKELENVVTAQTAALEQQMKRCLELESALGNVLSEYSNRINVSNSEISSLHMQLSSQNDLHGQQLQDLRNMYESKIEQLSQTKDVRYREELHEVLQTLTQSRDHFHKAANEMAQDMRESQETHHKEIIRLRNEVTSVASQLADKEMHIRELAQEISVVKQPVRRVIRLELEIDEGDIVSGYVSSSVLRPEGYQNKIRTSSNTRARSNVVGGRARGVADAGIKGKIGLDTIMSTEGSDIKVRSKIRSNPNLAKNNNVNRTFTSNVYRSGQRATTQGSGGFSSAATPPNTKSSKKRKFVKGNYGNSGSSSRIRSDSGFKSGTVQKGSNLMQKYNKYGKSRSKRTNR